MDKIRIIALTGAIGGFVGLALATPGVLPAATAAVSQPAEVLQSAKNDFFPPAPVDTDGLVKWDFTVDPGISMEPLKQSTIKKIGYGRVSYVEVVETTSGIYSSDAITDPHVQYPGIHVERKQTAESGLFVWSGHGWVAATPFGAGSFTTVVPFKGAKLVITDDGSCAVLKYTVAC